LDEDVDPFPLARLFGAHQQRAEGVECGHQEHEEKLERPAPEKLAWEGGMEGGRDRRDW